MAGEIHVLVVDENEDVLELTEAFLERESDTITVTTEQRVSEGINSVEVDDPDCIVSDFRMPEMDGLEFFEQVRDRKPDLPFFLVSATGDREMVRRAEEAGVTGFVRKDAGTEHYSELAERIEETA